MRCEYRRPVPVDVRRTHRRLSVVASCPVLSALVALAMVYPPPSAGSLIKARGASASAATQVVAVDRSAKGGRLVAAGATFVARWNAQDAAPAGTSLRPDRREKALQRQPGPKIMLGCEPAFSPLVRANFSARCLAGIGGRVMLAAAE